MLRAHLLFQLWTFSLCIHCKTITKQRICGFYKKCCGFSKFSNIELCQRQIFEISIIHKPSLVSREVPQKLWARSVQLFWRLLDTNKHPDKESKYIKGKYLFLYIFGSAVSLFLCSKEVKTAQFYSENLT